MSYKWPSKDPDETLDYSVDWSRFLGDEDSISTVTWFVDDADGVKTQLDAGEIVYGIQNITQTKTNTVATINLGLGVNNRQYKFTCNMTDTSGNTAERVIKLRIKER